MPTRQCIASYGVSTAAAAAAATITFAALLPPWRGDRIDPVHVAEHVAPTPPTKQLVDVVFAVDTTGSMAGLIEAAKRTVWSIATHIRDAAPDADLRVGLIAYRDIGDDYVTRDFALTGELDAVFTELSGYRAAGGGDTPEDVDAALDDAVHKMRWRNGAKQLVFLVGDAPPASRGDVPRYDVLAREAGDKQIIINAIRCGLDADTERTWRQIARLGHGEYASIRQDGGVQQVATPYDDRLAELSARIDRTTVIVGDDAARHAYARDMSAAATQSASAKADRARYYTAKGSGPRTKHDLVGGVASGMISVEAVVPSTLPEDLRAMNKAELKSEIENRMVARQAAEQELAELARQRDAYLKENAKGSDGFDSKVKHAIDAQLKN